MALLAIEKHINITLGIKLKADYQLYLSYKLISCFFVFLLLQTEFTTNQASWAPQYIKDLCKKNN